MKGHAEGAGTLPDLAPGIEAAFAGVPPERAGEPLAVEGELPPYLRGTCYLNGPARFQRGDLGYRHWLDGDGMVVALAFDTSGVTLTCRFVRGEKWCAEEGEGRALFRAFGTAFPGDRLLRGIALASPLNVSVYPWAGTLLAFGEQGLPWELDPETLETRGPYTFGGAVNPLSPMAAHAKIDPRSGELFHFGVSFSARDPRLNLYRFHPERGLVHRRRHSLELPCSLHDSCLSERHMAFYVSPYLVDMGALASDGRTLQEALSWEPQRGSRLLVFDRADGRAVASVPLGERYCLHTANAFERDGRLVVDLLELDRPVYDQYEVVPDLFTDVAEGRPVRLAVDLEEGSGGGRVERREIPYTRAPDFPIIDPRRAGRATDDLWMLGISATGRPGRKFFDQLVRACWSTPESLDVWQAPPGSYLGGEPVFVGDPARERAGVLLVPLFEAAAARSSFLVFDAFHLEAGPRARMPVDGRLHLAFHAAFRPAAST